MSIYMAVGRLEARGLVAHGPLEDRIREILQHDPRFSRTDTGFWNLSTRRQPTAPHRGPRQHDTVARSRRSSATPRRQPSTSTPSEAQAAADRLFQSLDERLRGRSELLERSGINKRLWPKAIRVLLDNGLVYKEGKKRGTRYSRAIGRVDPVARVSANSQVKVSYHDIVTEVFDELSSPMASESGLRN